MISGNSFDFSLILCFFLGIPPHVDTHSAFEDTIMSLSLGAQVRSHCIKYSQLSVHDINNKNVQSFF